MSSSTSGNLVSTTTNTSGGTTSSTTGVTPSVALPPNVDKPFNTPNEIKNFQDWLDSNYPTWLQNGKLNKSAGYGNYGTNTKNAYKAYGVIYNNYLAAKGMTQSTT